MQLHRKGYDIRHISELLCHGTLTTTKLLVDSDPIMLGDLGLPVSSERRPGSDPAWLGAIVPHTI